MRLFFCTKQIKKLIYRKNRPTSATLISATTTSLGLTFWWNIIADGAMISTGVSAKMVCATPVEMYCLTSSERFTPTKGPRTP